MRSYFDGIISSLTVCVLGLCMLVTAIFLGNKKSSSFLVGFLKNLKGVTVTFPNGHP